VVLSVLVRSTMNIGKWTEDRSPASEQFRGGIVLVVLCRPNWEESRLQFPDCTLELRTIFRRCGAFPEGQRERKRESYGGGTRGRRGKSPGVQLRLIARARRAAELGTGRVKWSREIREAEVVRRSTLSDGARGATMPGDSLTSR